MFWLGTEEMFVEKTRKSINKAKKKRKKKRVAPLWGTSLVNVL